MRFPRLRLARTDLQDHADLVFLRDQARRLSHDDDPLMAFSHG